MIEGSKARQPSEGKWSRDSDSQEHAKIKRLLNITTAKRPRKCEVFNYADEYNVLEFILQASLL